jgi:hypothetical protein
MYLHDFYQSARRHFSAFNRAKDRFTQKIFIIISRTPFVNLVYLLSAAAGGEKPCSFLII